MQLAETSYAVVRALREVRRRSRVVGGVKCMVAVVGLEWKGVVKIVGLSKLLWERRRFVLNECFRELLRVVALV